MFKTQQVEGVADCMLATATGKALDEIGALLGFKRKFTGSEFVKWVNGIAYSNNLYESDTKFRARMFQK